MTTTRLTNINNTSPENDTIASFDYVYDYDWQASSYTMLGQRTSVIATAPGAANIVSGLTKYSYDSRYQLVRTDYPNNTFEAWTYDAIGNRLSRRTYWGSLFPYVYYQNASGGNTQRLRNDSISTYDFTYDAAGNVTGANGAPNYYTWDYANRLTSYSGKTYTYDAFGRRSTTANGSTTRYIGQGDNTVGERNTTTGVATDYIFGPGIDEPLAKRTANGSITYFGVDGLGSVVVSTDLTGAVQSSTGYSPWGETVTTPAELFGYTGRETGGPSWYYRARHYDAVRGRFLSEDPIGLGGGVNVYAYVNNAPAEFVDPFGLDADDPTSCDYNPEDCRTLAQKIHDVINKLERLLRNENRQQANGTAFDEYDGHLEQWQNRKRQLAKLLRRFNDRSCDPSLLRGDVQQWGSEEYPAPPATFWKRYKRQVATALDDLMRQLARGPRSASGLPLPPFPVYAFP